MRYAQLRAISLVLFFLGGISALVYEVTWVRLLSLTFGVSVYAVSAVLTAFMGGLALGSWGLGRLATRIADCRLQIAEQTGRAGDTDKGVATPQGKRSSESNNLQSAICNLQFQRLLWLYAALAAGVGVCALLSPLLFSILTQLYVWIYNQFQPSFYIFNLIRFGLATLVLLLPASLMGGTLPVLGQLLARSDDRRGGEMGALYAANTFGGVVGTALAGLVLIRLLGVNGTIWLTAGIDFVIAGVAVGLSYRPLQFTAETQRRRERKSGTLTAEAQSPALSPSKGRRGAKVRGKGASRSDTPSPRHPVTPSPRHPVTPAQARLVLWGFGLSGFAALGYQVVWTRLLAIYSMNAIFSFAIMLTTFLVGLAIGGAVAARFVDRVADPLTLWGTLQLGIGLCGVLVLFIFARLYSLLAWFLLNDSFGTQVASEFFGAAVTLLLPTLLIGATFPVAVRVYGVRGSGFRVQGSGFRSQETEALSTQHSALSTQHSALSTQHSALSTQHSALSTQHSALSTQHSALSTQHSTGERVGRLYAVNTLGAMLGAFVAGFGLVPLLGLQRTALVLALVNLGVGAAALLSTSGRVPLLRLGGALGAALVAALLLPPGVYLGFRDGVPENDALAFYREGADATVAVFEVRQPPLKISFVNGRSEVPTDPDSMRAFYLLGHLPPLLRPEARSALMVSFGNGIATGAMSRHGISRIHSVELVAEQLEAARLYQQENRGVLDYPGLQITVEDGRNYLLRSSEQFDIITADATHPVNTSSWALFTREFYTLAQQRLAPEGVFVQWLPFHDLAQRDYRDIIRTFQSVFPHTSLWYTGGSHTFLVATPAPLTRAQVLALGERITAAGVGDDLGDGARLAADFLMDEEAVAAYVQEAQVVTDDRAFFIPARDREAIQASFAPYQAAQAR